MGNQDNRQAKLVAQPLEQRQNGARRRRVEPGSGLVGQQHRRVERQRPGDADALALAAGQLRRVAPRLIGQPDALQQMAHALFDFGGDHPRYSSGSATFCHAVLRCSSAED